ncbi:MAG: altronate dehydratase family protein [Sutterellaceae bacterium]|nr:altronate dehydratase family protein [Sutterellaceae bacterium]MDD7441309.1 altronate dehydratase family protein [Sutterellaceae bacterium]MDY2868282.1 altronate dehydratase family protein [Mesosutterella sp.]
MDVKAIRIREEDSVATLLEDARAGDAVRVTGAGPADAVTALDPIPFGHKVALRRIAKGEEVVKYGESIGRATADIPAGAWVHVQNLASDRGRGDVDSGTASPLSSVDTVMVTGPGAVAAVPDAKEPFFMGYPRPDGTAGTRNYVGVLSTVVCANDAASRVRHPMARVFTQQGGCSQTSPDVKGIERVLVNLARNPNLGAVVLVSLGCESVHSEAVAEEIRKETGKPVRLVVIQKEGSEEEAEKKLDSAVREFADAIKADRVPVPVSKLRLGLKCGSSDTTQGLSANPAAGAVVDRLEALGAGIVIGETTEFMGAEHIASRRAAIPEIGRAIRDAVRRMEDRARAMGVDMRGGQPTRGNIAGGLTTIEEKSLGALAKSGHAVFRAVVPYGEPPVVPGLSFMDSPGREPEMLTGLAAAGCNAVLFTTGRGAPQGFPFVPVLKVTGNSRTWRAMRRHMDCFAGGIMAGEETPAEAGARIFDALIRTASGDETAAEVTGYTNSMNIWTKGPTI